jgi:hypothetical protein
VRGNVGLGVVGVVPPVVVPVDALVSALGVVDGIHDERIIELAINTKESSE